MSDATGSGMILVIERDARFSAKFKKHLRLTGYRTFFVESGQDALFLLENISADFILINLNGIDSWDQLKSLILYGRKNKIPLLFVDGLRKTQSIADRLKTKGIDCFITLPFTVADLNQRVASMLGGRDPMIGRKLGPKGHEVQIIKKLGAGAMGTVYKADQEDLGRNVAVKFLSAEHQRQDPEAGKRFYNEARAMGQLRSPHIVQVYFVGKYEDRPYMVMELIEGPNLEKYMKDKGALTSFEALTITRDVLLGLVAAHGKGKTHRDLKPANIMLNRERQAVILDFGLVREKSQNMTKAGTVLGTPRYMSPEQVNGRNVDHRCDLYSTGIILYEMMVGTAPFRGEDFVSVLMKHVNEPLPRPEVYGRSVDPAVYAVIEKLTQKNPDDRYQTAREVLDHVEAHLETLSIPSFSDDDTMTLVAEVKPTGGIAVNSKGHAIGRFGKVSNHRSQHLYLLGSVLEQLVEMDDLGSFQRGLVDTEDRRIVVFPGKNGLACLETESNDLTTKFNVMRPAELARYFEKEATQ